MKRAITVEVAGQQFTFRTDADSAYVESLAKLVTDRIEEARRGSRTVSTQALAIMAAMHLADEVAKARDEHKQLRRAVREKSQKILAMLEKGAA